MSYDFVFSFVFLSLFFFWGGGGGSVWFLGCLFSSSIYYFLVFFSSFCFRFCLFVRFLFLSLFVLFSFSVRLGVVVFLWGRIVCVFRVFSCFVFWTSVASSWSFVLFFQPQFISPPFSHFSVTTALSIFISFYIFCFVLFVLSLLVCLFAFLFNFFFLGFVLFCFLTFFWGGGFGFFFFQGMFLFFSTSVAWSSLLPCLSLLF